MAADGFQPGFRMSRIDAGVLIAGAIGAGWASRIDGATAGAIVFVVAHFFLFCNVVRMSRSLELPWAGLFVALAVATAQTGWPGWWPTFGSMTVVTIRMIALQIRKPSYHGVFWRRINPELRSWWERERSVR